MFTVFSSFDIFALGLLSLFLVGMDTKLGFLAVWVIYFLFGVWFNHWTFMGSGVWVLNHTLDLIMIMVSYLIIGTLWSFFKWYLFVLDKGQKYRQIYEQYKANQERFIQKGYTTFELYLQSNYILGKFPPAVSDNKLRITDWILFWWFSMIQTILSDWVHKLVNMIYNMFYNFYDNIAKSVFSKIETP